MRMLNWLRSLVVPTRTPELKEWFHVRWDHLTVYVDVSPPGREAWSATFEWSSVVRVCFKAEDLRVSDGIYVFTSTRPESYLIPIEAEGGSAFWTELVRRGLFDAALSARAMSSTEGLFCWPA